MEQNHSESLGHGPFPLGFTTGQLQDSKLTQVQYPTDV